MAIQKSVLNDAEILRLLNDVYGIPADEVWRLSIGTANCYKVFAGDKAFFLKEYPDKFSKEDLQQETKLNTFLLERAFPTAGFIEDKTGCKYHFINGRYVALQEYLDGESYINHDLPDAPLFQAAELLGQLHELLAKYPLPVEMDAVWARGFNAPKASAAYDLLIRDAMEIKNLSIRDRITKDLIFKKEMLSVIAPYGDFFEKLTYRSTHGDYNAMQFLCGNGEIHAVIDFASAKKLPAVWEIMRSYMQSARDTENPAGFDMDKFIEYVRRYLKFSPLSEWDLRYMPYVYLYQLGRSRYGYREYMQNVENKDMLLRFAFWRTDVCRMLLERASLLSEKLCTLADKNGI